MAEMPPVTASAGAGDQVDKWLTANARARPLTPDEIGRYRGKRAVRGWRFYVDILGQAIVLDLTIDDRFPRSRPRIALAEPPAFPSYPHVEEDGGVCGLEEIDELDPTKPIAIIKAALGAAEGLLEQGLSGANQEDFRTEFLSYWNPTAKGDSIHSIVDPCGDTRRVKLWRGKSGYVVAEDRETLKGWLDNRLGQKLRPDQACDGALLLWLDQPLLPSDYPSTPADVRALAQRLGQSQLDAFDAFLATNQSNWLVLLGAATGDGTCFAAITIKPSQRHGWSKRKGVNGFRKGKVPAAMIANQALNGTLVRHRVLRADPWWIHGRDGNADLEALRIAKVVVIGCGSLGSPIARFLAEAGVGEIDLIDPELFAYANTGRHLLGSVQVGHNKAAAVALRLQRDFPHSRFAGHAARWQDVAACQPKLFEEGDLVISTIGSWSHEGELNTRQIEQGHPRATLYAWAQPHAAAGHAVLIGREGAAWPAVLIAWARLNSRSWSFRRPCYGASPRAAATSSLMGRPRSTSSPAWRRNSRWTICSNER